MGERRSPALAAPSTTFSGWDRALPYSLGYFEGLFNSVASLNLVLGAYHKQDRVELIFTDMELMVSYSEDPDKSPPTILSAMAYTTSMGMTKFSSTVADVAGIQQVSFVWDNKNDSWQSINLVCHESCKTFYEDTSLNVPRFYVQARDNNGNVTTGEWQEPIGLPLDVYLPLVIGY
jgi:hypothetical protein